MEIKKIKLFINDNDKPTQTANYVKNKLIDNHFEVVDDNFDLGIAIGGDGAFLRMVKATNFGSDVKYIGINTGTLGFLQELTINEIDEFILSIKNMDYTVDEVGIEQTVIVHKKGTSLFYSLNEIVIRDKELNTTKLDIKIADKLLETFIGDGILVATSVGSTAYNLSFGGSIVYNTFHTLQITPIAPLNTKAYRSLTNSFIIPSNKKITIIPRKDKTNLMITIDGENNCFENVSFIETEIKDKSIFLLRMKHYNFSEKVNEKFLLDS